MSRALARVMATLKRWKKQKRRFKVARYRIVRVTCSRQRGEREEREGMEWNGRGNGMEEGMHDDRV